MLCHTKQESYFTPKIQKFLEVFTFVPATLTVKPGETATVTLTATDNVGIKGAPRVDCTRGSFNVGDNTYTAPAVTADAGAVCMVWARDAVRNTSAARLQVFIIAPDPVDTKPPDVSLRSCFACPAVR